MYYLYVNQFTYTKKIYNSTIDQDKINIMEHKIDNDQTAYILESVFTTRKEANEYYNEYYK